MSKIKFQFKLTGLQIDFEGTSDEIKQISANFGQKITELMQSGVVNMQQKESNKFLTEGAEMQVLQPPFKAPKRAKATIPTKAKPKKAKVTPLAK